MIPRRWKMLEIARRLSTHRLTRLNDQGTELDNLNTLLHRSPDERGSLFFLGYYSRDGIYYALERYGIFEELRKRGFDDFILELDTHDPYRHRLVLYYEKKDDQHLLAEVVLKRKVITLNAPVVSHLSGKQYEVLQVEWLVLQNPQKAFTPERPRLPGQVYPGLGMGEMVVTLLMIVCWRLRLAGVLNVPEHFHNAYMYSSVFYYLNPEYNGRLKAMARDLLNKEKHHLAKVSWAVDFGCVRENGTPFQWFTAEQIIPIHKELKEYFRSAEYQELETAARKKFRYTLDETCWQRCKSQLPSGVLFPEKH